MSVVFCNNLHLSCLFCENCPLMSVFLASGVVRQKQRLAQQQQLTQTKPNQTKPQPLYEDVSLSVGQSAPSLRSLCVCLSLCRHHPAVVDPTLPD